MLFASSGRLFRRTFIIIMDGCIWKCTWSVIKINKCSHVFEVAGRQKLCWSVLGTHWWNVFARRSWRHNPHFWNMISIWIKYYTISYKFNSILKKLSGTKKSAWLQAITSQIQIKLGTFEVSYKENKLLYFVQWLMAGDLKELKRTTKEQLMREREIFELLIVWVMKQQIELFY